MKHYNLFTQDFGVPPSAPPPPPPSGAPPPPPPPSGQVSQASSRAIWSLILGIAAWVLGCSIFTGIPAWIMGKKELREIDEGRAPAAGRTMAQIGMWLGIVNTILSVLAIIFIIIYFVIIVAIIGSAN